MYEYKVLDLLVNQCENTFNRMAKEGWRVVTVSPNIAKGAGVIATMERKIDQFGNPVVD